MKHSKQTPKPSRALIAAVQRIERPMMRRVVARDAATVALVRSAALEVRALCEMWPGGERQCGLPANKSTGQGVAVCDRCLPRSLGEAEDMGGIFDLKTSERVAVPPPAPVAGEARRFVVGQRVRVTGDTHALGFDKRVINRHGVITRLPDGVGLCTHERETYAVCPDGDRSREWVVQDWWVHPDDLEPAPSPAVELEWTPEACGWEPATPQTMTTRYVHKASGAYVFAASDSPGRWWASNGRDYVTTEKGGPKPLAVACAMALGIDLSAPPKGSPFGYDATASDGTVLVCASERVADAESCARAALAAHRARGAR